MSRKSPSFRTLAIDATITVAALVAALVLWRRWEAAHPKPTPVPRETTAEAVPAASRQDPGVRALRSVLPQNAWVVVDVDLSLLGTSGWVKPSALGPLDCDDVPPPARLAFAVLPHTNEKNAAEPGWPSARGSAERPLSPPAPDAPRGREEAEPPELVVVALRPTPAFRECARRKLLAEGGDWQELPNGFELVENASHTRLLSNARNELLMFATASAPPTDELIALARGERPSTADSRHHALAEALGPRALGMTAALPPAWLERAGGGAGANESPLGALEAAALGVRVDGSLEARFSCAESAGPDGCARLAAFLRRAKSDLLLSLPEARRAALEAAFQVDVQPYSLHVTWRIPPEDVAELAAPLLGG